MTNYCSVFGCFNNTRITPQLSFFLLPKDEERKKTWTELIHRNDILRKTSGTRYYVCSVHFSREMIINKRLKSNAVPSINLPGTPGSQSQVPLYDKTSKKDVETQTDKQVLIKQSQSGEVILGDTRPIGEEGDDRIDDDKSIYERDVSPIRTTDDGEAMVPEGSSRRHEGYRCTVCRGGIGIVGYRYACVQCANCDLCGACEARGEHATHYVLRVPPNKLDSDARAVIQKIREQLLQENIQDSIKIEIKIENDSEQEQDPLEKTCDDGPADDTSYQNIHNEKSKVVMTVKGVGINKEASQPVFKVEPGILPHQAQAQSHQPTLQCHRFRVQSHRARVQSRQPKVQSHQVKPQSQQSDIQSQDPPVARQEKRPRTPEDPPSSSEESSSASNRKKRKK